MIESVEAIGPYVNARLRRPKYATTVLKNISSSAKQFGKITKKKARKIVLEYVSPNTNKPLHLGHLRNAALGWSLSQILKNVGDKIITAQLINDRGIHTMKSLLAYERWGGDETPTDTGLKGDHLVGKYYIRFAKEASQNPSLEDEAHDYLRRWEAGDKKLIALWKKLTRWAEQGLNETYKRLGLTFDRTDYESDIYKGGREIILAAVKKNLAIKKSDGSVAVDLTTAGLDEKILLRADGTSVYITQDLALASRRLANLKPDLLLYIVGQEQDYHFKVLFSVLDKFHIANIKNLRHLSYHWVFLPDGRMKSREGKVTEADDLLDEIHELAATEITKRHPDLKKSEINKRAEIITLAAVKFYLLRVRRDSDIKFNPEESIALTGQTGPYLLYTYARLQSIFRKAKKIPPAPKVPQAIDPSAWSIITMLGQYPDEVGRAAVAYDPSIMADYTYRLTRTINDFYETAPVLTAEPTIRAWRLQLLRTAATILKNSLTLMGIKTLEEM